MRHVVVHFDILVIGVDDKDHLQKLRQMLSRLQEACLMLKVDR